VADGAESRPNLQRIRSPSGCKNPARYGEPVCVRSNDTRGSGSLGPEQSGEGPLLSHAEGTEAAWECRSTSRGLGGDTFVDASTAGVRSCPVPTNRLRYVKENKRKRRANQREGKRTSTPLAPVSFNSTDKTTNRSDNKFACLEDDDGELRCTMSTRLMGKAKSLIRFFETELGIVGDSSLLPPRIDCGHLRPAVRGCFPSELSTLEELSLKTSQKVERGCCKNCGKTKFASKISEWKEAMLRPANVDAKHLNRFRKALRQLVPKGWNKRKGAFIPNGSATLDTPVKHGGNWQRRPFSDLCKAKLVFSSGKPRVVTLYSSYNTEVLAPLHRALYSMMEKRGWLLVGEPTADRVARLNGNGDFLSFDYVGATDNIKVAYTIAAVETLIEFSEDLSSEEERCLRVLCELKLGERTFCKGEELIDRIPHDVFERGQPMGSAMSFPLLCLINKAVVDLSLADLLENKKNWMG